MQSKVDEILNSFNTWRFKREQPSNIELLRQFVNNCVNEDEPIHFVTYWGKGDKNAVGESERATLDFLLSFLERIKSVYNNGADITIIFTDTHAELNGRTNIEIKIYFDSLKKLTVNYGFECILMSNIINLDIKSVAMKIDNVDVTNSLLNQLVESARKHYKTNNDYLRGAKLYYLQNQLEKVSIGKTFNKSVFLTFNGSTLNDLFPMSLPIFYMYSMRKGVSVKPWFV